MKIILLYAVMTGFEHKLNVIIKNVKNTFKELGVEILEIELQLLNIPYYDGIKSQSVENIFKSIKQADAVIFACTAQRLAPCAIMQTFIEHFDTKIYENVLKNKNCMIITASSDGSEGFACEYLSHFISLYDGIDINKMAIGKKYISDEKIEKTKEMIEKYVEDFYRMLRQNREFFPSSVISSGNEIKSFMDLTDEQILDLFGDFEDNSISEKKIKSEELLKKVDLEFSERQEQDIDEITKMISKQYGNNSNKQSSISNLYKENSSFGIENIVPHIETCKQRTQSLYHYFQPQISSGINIVIQINITGKEIFEGYIVIKDKQCKYFEGISDEANVTIFADSDVWEDILEGKYTTQKAFMIGQLKVRGNFVLLSKFDQLFKMRP